MPTNNPRCPPITVRELDYIKSRHEAKGYAETKWSQFCRVFLAMPGVEVRVYKSKSTPSKYVYVGNERLGYWKTRFSQHPPIESRPDCDFFVGRSHRGWTNTGDAIQAAMDFLSRSS